MAAPRSLLLLLVCTLSLTACRDQKVSSYRVPKEKDPELPAAAAPAAMMPGAAAGTAGGSTNDAMANTAVPTAQGNDLVWIAPASWKAKPAAAMRKGSYSLAGDDGKEADLSITAFPNDVGGLLANLNRWRGQIQLPPITEAELPHAITHLDSNGLHLTVIDLSNPAGAEPKRVIGAIIPFEGATWFFKLSGPASVVGKEQTAFADFIKSIKAANAP